MFKFRSSTINSLPIMSTEFSDDKKKLSRDIKTLRVKKVSSLNQDQINELTIKYQQHKEFITYLCDKAQLNEKVDGQILDSLINANDAVNKTRQALSKGRANVPESYASYPIMDKIRGIKKPVFDLQKIRLATNELTDYIYHKESLLFKVALRILIARMYKTGFCGEFALVTLASYAEKIKDGEQVYISETDDDHHWTTIETSNPIKQYNVTEKSFEITKQKIIADAWCYGPALLFEDYSYYPTPDKILFDDYHHDKFMIQQLDQKIKTLQVEMKDEIEQLTKTIAEILVMMKQYSFSLLVILLILLRHERKVPTILDFTKPPIIKEYQHILDFSTSIELFTKESTISNDFLKRITRYKSNAESNLLKIIREHNQEIIGVQQWTFSSLLNIFLYGKDNIHFFVKKQINVLDDIRKVSVIRSCLNISLSQAVMLTNKEFKKNNTFTTKLNTSKYYILRNAIL